MKFSQQKRYFIIIAVISILVALSGCTKTKPIEKFKKAVENNNPTDAIEIYKDKLMNNEAAQSEAESFINEYVSRSLSDYGNGAITNKDFENRYKTIETIVMKGDCSIDRPLIEIHNSFETIRVSKDKYIAGEKAYSARDYASAIKHYSRVVPEDTEHYSDAQDKLNNAKSDYEANVLDLANKAVESKNYVEAFQVIDSAIEVIETEKLKDYRVTLCETYESTTIDKAQNLADEGKYEEAFQCLTDAIGTIGNSDKLNSTYSSIYVAQCEAKMKASYDAKDYLSVLKTYVEEERNILLYGASDNIKNYYSSSIKEYLADIDSQAESAFGESKDYSAAIQILRSALSDVNNLHIVEITTHLEEKIAYYQEYVPIILTHDSAYAEAGDSSKPEQSDDICTDGFGKMYDSNEVFTDRGGSEDIPRSTTFYVSRQYNKLSGTIYVPFCSLKCDPQYPPIVRICGDNDEILYEFNSFNGTMEPVNFTVDITGHSFIRVEIDGGWYRGDGTGRMPCFCVTNLFVAKTQ